jgi:hypothetical protein
VALCWHASKTSKKKENGVAAPSQHFGLSVFRVSDGKIENPNPIFLEALTLMHQSPSSFPAALWASEVPLPGTACHAAVSAVIAFTA